MPHTNPPLDEIERCIEARTALLSPVRRIPGELLYEIFTHLSYTRKFDALLEHSHRCCVFHAHIRGVAKPILALSGLHDRIPQLREFVLIQVNIQPVEGHSYLSTAPALRKLLLTDSNLRLRSPYVLTAPWHQITHYRASCTAQQNFDVLLTASRLVQCGLGFIRVEPLVDYPAGKHAVLPHLRHLKLGAGSEAQFLTHVTAGPALENLAVCAPYTAVPSFLRRSSSGRFLTQLYLDDDYMNTTAEEIVKVLRETQALRTLGISCGNPMNNEMEEVWSAMTMTMKAAANNICPVLRSLVYACKGEHEAVDASFFPMVQSRCGEIPAGSVILESLPVVAIDTHPEFVESVKQGMGSLPHEFKSQVLEGKEGEAFLSDFTFV
ncbi:hypothetical protein FB45DRAFT_1063398 [Roridomyces roridus]|uniref:Uncharacterized protein n=1 Tax=Roridomyces roridus TaxID=1738132 RepID=A0AAD7FGR2_9AGAR|nr:hypothetical protein FB45DRAFT_1063398 [Roridomyces roridus]